MACNHHPRDITNGKLHKIMLCFRNSQIVNEFEYIVNYKNILLINFIEMQCDKCSKLIQE